MDNLEDLFESFSFVRVAVVGDVMLDTYWWGRVDRISPEAPVPIVAVSKRETRIGGAGNVALNLLEMGASVALLSVTGNDDDGHELEKLLAEKNIDTNFIHRSASRLTTNKIRIISRNQQMMRLDVEHTSDIDAADEEAFLDKMRAYLRTNHPDIVILEDYNKGVLTERVITGVIALCQQNNIPTSVDPKYKNFFCYRNVTIIKPNFLEATTALGLTGLDCNEDNLKKIHNMLKERLDHDISLVTLSEHGIYYQNKDVHARIPSHRRNIADVSGAGDTVISVASLVFAKTKNIALSAKIANIAGGVVCEEVGTVPVQKQRLLEECKKLLSINDF